ncbi:MAG TPA: SH3 domain-containing protein [Candidatus Acidoferrales bacterium]
MNLRFAAVALLVGTAVPAYAGTATTVYTQCGAHDGYILMYRSLEKFDEGAKLRCGERVEVLNQGGDYLQVTTPDGKKGWLLASDTSADAPADAVAADAVVTDSAARSYAANVPAMTLTNRSILDLHHAHVSSDAIVTKIRFSECSFNTSDYSVHELKAAGVSDKVILAMLETQQPSSASNNDVQEVKVIVPGGTPVEVALSREVAVDELHEGAVVNMTVMRDVTVNGVVVISHGASARARVMAVRKPGLGKTGEVAWFMQDAATVTGDSMPVAFASKQPNQIPTGRFEGYAFLLSQYRKGAPALVPNDRTFIAIVNSDTIVRMSQALAHKPSASGSDRATAVNLLDR